MSGVVVVLIIVAALAVLAYGWYVALVRRRNSALEALSSVDVQLQKRHDLLPNILKIANRFMKHERELLSRITELRSQAMKDYRPEDPEEVRQHLDAAGALQGAMFRLFAVAENYPELRSSENMLEAQQTFTEVEGHIAAARRFYNAAVSSLNNAVQIFPGSIIAGIANVTAMPFFEVEDEVIRQPVDADAYLQ